MMNEYMWYVLTSETLLIMYLKTYLIIYHENRRMPEKELFLREINNNSLLA